MCRKNHLVVALGLALVVGAIVLAGLRAEQDAVAAQPVLTPALYLPSIIRQSHSVTTPTPTPSPSATASPSATLTPTMSPTPTQSVNIVRAVAAYNAMQQYLYHTNGTSLYRETWPPGDGNPYAYHWPFSHAVTATLDMLGLSADYRGAVQDRIHNGSPKYWNSTSSPPGYDSYVRPPLGSGGDKFYDDHAWTGLNLVRAYRLTGDEAALDRARQVFEFVKSGWDNDPTHPAPGGVFWVQADWSRDRNTVSNAPSAELGLRLYLLTGEPSYLEWARKMYDWTQTTMLDRDSQDQAVDGLYWDHIDLSGRIDKTQWSYNQGTMIGASVLLYTVTRDEVYLTRARDTANLALNHYGRVGYFSQSPAFNAIFFRNLLLLASVDDTYLPATLQAMSQYADTIWTAHRSPAGLFRFPANASSVDLINQAAMVEIFAGLAGDPRDYDLLTGLPPR